MSPDCIGGIPESKAMAIEKILVLEDDTVVRDNLETYLRRRRYDVTSVATVAATRETAARDNFDLIFLDVRLPDGDGTELLKQFQTRPQRPLVVMMTGFGTVESAVECMKNGAFDYLIKPFSNEQIEITLRKAGEFTRLVNVNRFLSQETGDAEQFLLGNSPAIENLRQLIRKVARTQATVLIQGESGTGKELVARALYRESARATAPFIKLNCAAIPENLIESEFFGHEKGAFTGALNKREGRFELAHGGTILLDEISEISPNVQAKLLRVLQERELERVGGNRTLKVDVRVIATTNRNLEQSVEKKEFRQDLFFRLNVVPISVPPLREHRQDVQLLADEFTRRFSRRHGVRFKGFTDAAIRILENHSWPGNVRELQNVVERAVILCGDNGIIEVEHLGLLPSNQPAQIASPVATARADRSDAFPTLAELEKRHIFAALEHCQGNRTHAAKLLDVSIRTLRNKLHEYNGTVPKAADEYAPTAG
ncbi:MAG TPA: sigma-54 dependent transcriptional regulator [Candidatus Sulfopaludibacter sp.]|nr:sigma-54 dependent transcriptional regulator [Candidatus Sulfopaludibacter sp.]